MILPLSNLKPFRCCRASFGCPLSWGTKRENMRDQYGHGTRVVADKHPKSKLTPSMVEHIRTSPMTGVELARTMGLGTATICRVRQGKSSATLLGAAPSA